MFKKIGLGVLAALVLAMGVFGVVMAQEPEPPAEEGVVPQMPGRMFGGRGHGRGIGFPRGEASGLAEAFGMTPQELMEALADGQTIAELAEANDVDLAEVFDGMVMPGVERFQMAQAQREEMQATLAEALGISVEALEEALAEGQTIAEVAEAQGIALEDLAGTLADAQIARLKEALEDGTMRENILERMLQRFENGQAGGRDFGRPQGKLGFGF